MRPAAAAGRLAVVATTLALAAVSVPFAAAGPIQTYIDSAAVRRAIDLGRSRSDLSRSFHDRYVIPLGDRSLERLEIITEFRRVVLAAEERSRFGDMTWGPEQAEARLRPWRGRITLLLHVVFSPNNTYRAMPRFDIVLYAPPASVARRGAVTPRSDRIEPIDIVETPRYVSGQPAPPGTPILAGLVQATFNARTLDSRNVYLAGIFLEDRELRRVELDFSAIE